MIRLGIIGASGYAGREVFRLALSHPECEVTMVTSTSRQGVPVSEVIPSFKGRTSLAFEDMDVNKLAEKCDAVFLGLPSMASAELTGSLLDAGLKVLDLGADFRLKDPADYDVWYGARHPHPELLEDAVYGFTEHHAEDIASAKLVAVPGCYPVACILGASPILAAHKAVLGEPIIINATSGYTGCGASASAGTHMPTSVENMRAYKVTHHQHTPEIEQELINVAGKELKVLFTPHLAPVVRGILATSCIRVKPKMTLKELQEIYENYYRDSHFVRVCEGDELPETRNVRGVNFCDVAVRLDKRTNTAVVVSVIDNMVRGTAGMAIECLNLMFGLPISTGLDMVASGF